MGIEIDTLPLILPLAPCGGAGCCPRPPLPWRCLGSALVEAVPLPAEVTLRAFRPLRRALLSARGSLFTRKRRNTERGPEAGVRGASPGLWVRRTGGVMCAYSEGGLSVYIGGVITYSHFVCLCVCSVTFYTSFFI